MKTNEQINAIVEQLVARIRLLPDGTNTSTDNLLIKLGIIIPYWNEGGKQIHYTLLEAARKEDIYLETDCIDSIDEDIPYSLGFTIYHNTPCYWNCGVGFEDIMTVYPYTSNIGHISSCTYVEVPFGNKNSPVIGQVQCCGIYKRTTIPDGINREKYIIRITTKEEYDKQPYMDLSDWDI